jgi:hypothetical protein
MAPTICNILEKVNLPKLKKDQWLPGVRDKDGINSTEGFYCIETMPYDPIDSEFMAIIHLSKSIECATP